MLRKHCRQCPRRLPCPQLCPASTHLDGTDPRVPLLPALTRLQPLFQRPPSEPPQPPSASRTSRLCYCPYRLTAEQPRAPRSIRVIAPWGGGPTHCLVTLLCRPPTPTSLWASGATATRWSGQGTLLELAPGKPQGAQHLLKTQTQRGASPSSRGFPTVSGVTLRTHASRHRPGEEPDPALLDLPAPGSAPRPLCPVTSRGATSWTSR